MKGYTYLRSKDFTVSVFAVIFLILSIGLQHVYDTRYAKAWVESETYTVSVMPAKVFPYMSFGFENALSDFYWLTIIQDLTLKYRNTLAFRNYFENIAALDPQFTYPYTFAIFIFPTKQNLSYFEHAKFIADLGIKNNPDNYEIPYYLAFQYHIVMRAYSEAVRYFAIAATRPDSPELMKRTYVKYSDRSLERTGGTDELIKSIFETTDNAAIKVFAKKEMVLSHFTKVLTDGLAAYKKKHGEYPETILQMTSELGTPLPTDFYERVDIAYNKTTGAVSLAFK